MTYTVKYETPHGKGIAYVSGQSVDEAREKVEWLIRVRPLTIIDTQEVKLK